MLQSSIRLSGGDIAQLNVILERTTCTSLSDAIVYALDFAADAVRQGVDWAFVRRTLLNNSKNGESTTRSFDLKDAFAIVREDIQEQLSLERPRVAFIVRMAVTYTVLALQGNYLPTAAVPSDTVSEHERLELLSRLTRLALEATETADRTFLAVRELLKEVRE
ncbi:MAG: hypothetical protein IJ598_12035 [Ruminococcus sp.]|nr:hypothetical protein [Ruminococcus sp.]